RPAPIATPPPPQSKGTAMPCPSKPRLLLLLPTATYRAAAFVEAARCLGVELTVASELPSTFQQAQPDRLVTLEFSDPERAAQQAYQFARTHPIAGVTGVDDTAAVGGWTRYVRVEDFVPGPEVALEGLVIEGRLHVLALFDKPDPLDGPFFEETIYLTPSRLPEPARRVIVECGQAAVAALGVREGPIHAELRYNAGGPWLIELAARSIGGRCSAVLRFTAGERGGGKGCA